MLSDNTYHAGEQAALPILGKPRDDMNVCLNESDRRSVDMLLAGDGTQSDALDTSMTERVNSVRRFLGLLEAMPADEPKVDLTEATLRKIAAIQAVPAQPDSSPSASL